MLIKFNKIKLHNFISFDDAELDLSDLGYVSVEGRNYCKLDNAYSNGSGKSSIFNGICFALTGETAQGISKGLENIFSDPEDCWVELHFSINNDEFIIRRYRTPRPDMKIWINGEDRSGKGIRESSKLLAEYIPDLTPTLLNSIIILGQGLPSRFTNNNPARRKEILETLTKSDFMIESIKDKLEVRQQDLKASLRVQEDLLLAEKTKLDLYSIQLDNYKKSLSEFDINDIDTKILDLNKKLLEVENNINLSNDKLNDLNKELVDNTDKNSQLQSDYLNKIKDSTNDIDVIIINKKKDLGDIYADIKGLEKEIKKLDAITDICPTCGQKIPSINKPDTTKQKEELNNFKVKYSNLESEISDFEKEKNKIVDDLSDELNKLSLNIKERISDIMSDISSITTENKNNLSIRDNINNQISNLNNYKSNYNNIINNINDTQKLINDIDISMKDINKEISNINLHLNIVQQMLTLARREFRGILLFNIISYINKKVKQYSKIVFDTEELDFILDGNAIDISYCNKQYENLSGGEKQKIDIIVQLALRDILSKQLDIHSNILVVDEIFDNLDLLGCRKIMSLISGLSDIESVFIISHHAQDLELTSDIKILVEKNESGISSLKVV